MPHIILDNRKLVSFSGPDARHLLHNVFTCDVEKLQPGVAQIGALLTPQGKIMFDFFVSKSADDDFTIEIDAENAAGFAQRMTMYRLRSNVEISEPKESLIRISWDDDSTIDGVPLRDSRFKSVHVERTHIASGEATKREPFDLLRIKYGVAESSIDFQLGDAFPHDVSLDQNGGVDFKKGCYVGQEVVSRVHHRKTARRRILRVISETEMTTGDIIAGGKLVGTVGTIVGSQALAVCRIDRVKDAMDAGQPITVNDTAVTLSLPDDVTYTWPEETADA